MEWLLDLTAEQMRERSSKELQDFLTPEKEKKCMENFNKFIFLAIERGSNYVYFEGFSPSKKFLPLFSNNMASDMPLMTQKLKEHLEKNGLKVSVYEPFFSPHKGAIDKALQYGMHYGSVYVSWEKKEEKKHF